MGAGMRIVISGETGAGKTTLVRAMTNVLSVDTRIVVIEDTRELNLGADPRAGQQRPRVGDAGGQHRGRRRDRPARAGPPRAAVQPQVADRRRGPRRRRGPGDVAGDAARPSERVDGPPPLGAVGVEEAGPVRRPGLRGRRVPDRRPADLRRRRLLRPPRSRPARAAASSPRSARSPGGTAPRCSSTGSSSPAPTAGRCPSPTSPTCAARSCATTASRTTCCSTPPGGGRREPVAAARRAARGRGRPRRVPRRRRLARPARPSPPDRAAATAPELRPRRHAGRPGLRSVVVLAGWWTGLAGRHGRVRAARLDGPVVRRAAGPAAPPARPVRGHRRLVRDAPRPARVQRRPARGHRQVGPGRPGRDPRRGQRPVRQVPARRPVRRRSPASPTRWTTPSPTPS